MNDTKPLYQSKTLIGLAVALLGPWLAKQFGLTLTDGAQQELADQLIQAIGAALAVYGRLKAGTGLHLKPPGNPLLALALGAGLLTGCATWEGFSPGTQAVIKAGAKLALSFGVRELGERVKEVRPYEDRLRALIELTFAKPLPAEELGTLLKAGVVAIVPAELRDAVLAQFREALTGGTAPAASSRHADFNRRLARQL